MTPAPLTTAAAIRRTLRAQANVRDAQNLSWFFKTGPGEYGEGDRFLGLRVPALRARVKSCDGLPLREIVRLLHSPFHEERLFALLVMVRHFQRGDAPLQAELYRAYLANTAYINNWDLVDLSAAYIVGPFLQQRDRAVLDRLAASSSLWERRIAVLSTFHFIRQGDFADALRIARHLLRDEHDLIHKAVGWMLREVGKRDLPTEERFLRAHARVMPRTMLRYAIEKFPELKRRAYLRVPRTDAS